MLSIKIEENSNKAKFYKTNPSGISLIVLVITIIVIIILATAIIVSIVNNNPINEANKARINSDVANMQAIFTNTVGKIMAENQDIVTIIGGTLYTTPTGIKKTTGEATYQILGTDGTPVVEGKIKFSTEKGEGTTYCTGKELPLYGSDTKWSVDNQGLLLVEVGGVLYGEGEQVEEEGEEIAQSDNPMLQSWTSTSTTDFHAEEYRSKITKVKFAIANKVSSNKIEAWDVSEAKDKSVMAWVEDDENGGYILTIAGKEKIIANTNSSCLFYKFNKVTEIENIYLLDTSNVTNMRMMFGYCNYITSLDLSNFNTNNVIDMSGMFRNWYKCESLDLSNFDTSNVTTMDSIFENSSFVSLNLDGWDTSKVTYLGRMFFCCYNLISLGEKGLDISGNITDMQYMFGYTQKLKTVLNIKGSIRSCHEIFYQAISDPSAQITLNYTAHNESLVDTWVNNKGESNIVKGIKLD